jgi:hypothetical protein
MQYLAPIVLAILFVVVPGSMVFALLYGVVKWWWDKCPTCRGRMKKKDSNLYCITCAGSGKRKKDEVL